MRQRLPSKQVRLNLIYIVKELYYGVERRPRHGNYTKGSQVVCGGHIVGNTYNLYRPSGLVQRGGCTSMPVANFIRPLFHDEESRRRRVVVIAAVVILEAKALLFCCSTLPPAWPWVPKEPHTFNRILAAGDEVDRHQNQYLLLYSPPGWPCAKRVSLFFPSPARFRPSRRC